jgi:photosystem II stability/assembly factor-like uncharacterized protein
MPLRKHSHGQSARPAGLLSLLFACLFLLASCSGAAGGNGSHPVSPGPQSFSQPVALREIHMLDILHGWAITRDGMHLLRTTTGVTHWIDVTPGMGARLDRLDTGFFLDAFHAWTALVPGGTAAGTGALAIAATSDGGQSWSRTPLPDTCCSVTQISFVDALHGWCLVGGMMAANHEAIDILRTNDGGKSWISMTYVDGLSAETNGLPSVGDKTGLSFLNAITGWVTASNPIPNTAWLYRTRDAGSTWQPQTLPLPPGSQGQVTTSPPVFFNATSGVLPVALASSVDMEDTSDGGASWHATAPVSASSALLPSGLLGVVVAFRDANDGWIGNAPSPGDISVTSDGGYHWRLLFSGWDAGITSLTQIDFLSRLTGWVIGSTSSHTTFLLQTLDEGKTWKRVVVGM